MNMDFPLNIMHHGHRKWAKVTNLWLWCMYLLHPIVSDTFVSPPVFTQQPQAGSAEVQGNTKVLLCQATGVPSPVYRWKKDGAFIQELNITDTSLKLQRIRRDDAGIYQCVAYNNHGAILSNRVVVHVAYIVPFAMSGSPDKTVDQGQARIINLPRIDSYPAPTIDWFQGYTPVPREALRYHVTLKNQLVILATRSPTDNNMKFRATAMNSYTDQRSNSQDFVMKVQNVGSKVNDIPPSIVVPPSDTTAVQGDDVSVVLECVANARPLSYLTINWYKKTSTGRTKITRDAIKYLFSVYTRRLTIKTPQISDSGLYECEASFKKPGGPVFPKATAIANLTVLVKPRFASPPPSEMKRDYGVDVTIPCQAVAIPRGTVTWHRNAELLTSQGRYKHLNNGNLQIKSVNPTDAGMFQCFVKNAAGEINAATWLRVLSSPPKIFKKPQNTSVIAGESVRFPCETTGAPKPTTKWHRVTVQSGREELDQTQSRFQVLDKELLLPVANIHDTGIYTCNATNSKGSDAVEVYLKVAVRTRIVSPPQNASVIKGSTTVLQCGVTKDKSVTVFWTWYHNNRVLPTRDPEGRRMIKQDGSLQISSVRNSDIGSYRCMVKSSAGNDTGRASLKVIELPYPPSITSVALNAVSKRAVDVRWNPGFDGNSPIKNFVIQFRIVQRGVQLLENDGWKVSSRSIPAKERVYTANNLMPARTYQFRVSAVNDVGEGSPSAASAAIELPQQPPSGPPRGVVGSPRSNSSILIQWQPPDEDKWNGPLLGYMIRYKLAGYPDSTLSYSNISGYAERNHALKNLITFNEYEISVAAYNKKGVGVYSSTIHVMTKEGHPVAPPKSVQAVAQSSTTIHLTWYPPDPPDLNGINQGYKIEAHRPNSLEPVLRLVVPSNPTNMVGQQSSYLRNLKKYTEYSITILCYTNEGNGPKSKALSVTTLEDVPDVVGSLEPKNIRDTAVDMYWSLPVNINGELQGYTMSYMKTNHSLSKMTKHFGPRTLNYTITGLHAITKYTVEIFARTRVGRGLSRVVRFESGREPVKPEAPRNLAISNGNIEARTVLIQFNPGNDGFSSISKWVIEAQVNKKQEWTVVYEISDPDAQKINVQKLRPFTYYRFRIIAENIAGRSGPSEPSKQIQTIQAPPSNPPQEVTVRAVNESALRVRWTPLVSGSWNGEECGYKIKYKPQSSLMFTNEVPIPEMNANSYTVVGLEEWTEYDIQVAAFNKKGYSAFSPVARDRTRESVPGRGPTAVNATALSSTTVKVKWSTVPEKERNGLILGYKVQYGSKSENISPVKKDVQGGGTSETLLTGLRKFIQYEIQVLAYTRIGDGVLSTPAKVVKTHDDVPGPPSGVYFPDVTATTVKVVWSPPREPNGVITGYRVAYREKNNPPKYAIVKDDLGPGRRDRHVANLRRLKYYVFTLTAKTRLGWGHSLDLEVITKTDRMRPDPPSRPTVGPSQVGPRWVSISWQPESDGYGPIRNYSIQVKKNSGAFELVPLYVPPSVTLFTVKDLTPNSLYSFRIAASNDIGLSGYSAPSDQVKTTPAAPESPPSNLQVMPRSTSSVHITWKSPPEKSWNGNLKGFNVYYRKLKYTPSGATATTTAATANNAQNADAGNDYQRRSVLFPTNSMQLANLQPDTDYEIKVNAYNSQGPGPFSRPVDIFVGEAVPTGPPQLVTVQPKSSTEVTVTWKPPPPLTQNGDLLGYKIFYWVTGPAGIRRKRAADSPVGVVKMVTAAATDTAAVLQDLRMFTTYSITMLAFNAAGDGPNITNAITATTLQGVPGRPGILVFTVTSLNSVNVSWAPPAEPNGHILAYEVSYYQDQFVDGESRSMQVRMSGKKRFYLADNLNDNVKYVFSVKAKTKINWGPPRIGNITTGPQPGSPQRPWKPSFESKETQVMLSWKNGNEGDSPITGYIIQAKQAGTTQWVTIKPKNGPKTGAIISFFDLNPDREYQFRIIAINSKGISEPSEPSEMIRTPDFRQQPFYKQWWFLVIVALTGVIIIVIVVSLLCFTGRRKKVDKFNDVIPKTSINLQDTGSSSVEEDGGFATFEMRMSQRRNQRKLPKRDALPPYIKSPPRPSPGSVNYSDEDGKYPDEDSSSLTEKPSEASSSTGSTQSQEESDSDVESYVKEDPNAESFVNHYVNDPVRQSWKRQHKPSNAYSYTDSEAESHYQYAPNMNGGHIIMNNMAGSRAPLPGFSSFV